MAIYHEYYRPMRLWDDRDPLPFGSIWRNQSKVGSVFICSEFWDPWIVIHNRVCMVMLFLLIIMKRASNKIGHLVNTNEWQSYDLNLVYIWLHSFLITTFPRCTIWKELPLKQKQQKQAKTKAQDCPKNVSNSCHLYPYTKISGC